MYEFLAILVGLLVGLVVWQIERPRLRIVAIIVAGVILGPLVSAMAGELAESWAFAVLDAAQVMAGAVVALAVVTRLRTGTFW
jgi:hypothetical protein